MSAHRSVDAVFSKFELSERESYTQFLQAHRGAYRALGSAAQQSQHLSALIQPRIDCLETDLSALGAAGSTPAFDLDPPHHWLGAAYVVTGAHFGARVLRRSWAMTKDARVREAGSYLAIDGKPEWRDILMRLGMVPVQGRHADAIISAATATFHIFETTGQTALGTQATAT